MKELSARWPCRPVVDSIQGYQLYTQEVAKATGVPTLLLESVSSWSAPSSVISPDPFRY